MLGRVTFLKLREDEQGMRDVEERGRRAFIPTENLVRD